MGQAFKTVRIREVLDIWSERLLGYFSGGNLYEADNTRQLVGRIFKRLYRKTRNNGAVQLDWARANGWRSHNYGDNWKDYRWMEEVFWLYTCELPQPHLQKGQRLFFISRGIDYRFEIRLDGNIIYSQEGMFTPVELDLTDMLSPGAYFEVLVYPAPSREGAPEGRCEADQSCKPAVSYGWDWHPRLVPLGIWDDTWFEVRESNHIIDAEVKYSLGEDLGSATVELYFTPCRSACGKLVWRLLDQEGQCVLKKENVTDGAPLLLQAEITKPGLWWPNGYGKPLLYKSIVELYDTQGNLTDSRTTSVGFRRIRLVMHKGAWSFFPKEFPMTRANPPITLEVNGRHIFGKGTNWVNPEIFPGIITENTYKPLVKMAAEANMNLLRQWGGAIVNKESFYELCDRLGLMVWQEFPLACNNYEGTSHYLDILDQESKPIIKRLRRHACVVMWCGGNELFNSWSGMTDQSNALRLLNRNCFDLDPDTPFIMTSPVMGMGHGCYLFRYRNGEEVFQVMPRAQNTAYTEFGVPSPSSVEVLKAFIPEGDLFPPKPGTAWETHHAFGAWGGGGPNTWLMPELIEEYFGPSSSLEQLVERGQLLQTEGYKCIFEEARRQKPRCSMALNWCYNEPWPCAANNSLVMYPAKPKPSFYGVKASCRPVLASARIPKFTWREGEIFNPELWILNDLPSEVAGGIIRVFLNNGTEDIELLEWKYSSVDADTNLPGPTVRFILPCWNTRQMVLKLVSTENPVMNSEYTLLYEAATRPDSTSVRTMNT